MPDYRRRATREAMSVRLDVNGMIGDVIGAAGVTREEVDGLAARISEVTHSLRGRRADGEIPILDLPYQKNTIAQIKALANEVRELCDTLVVLSTGGAALGARVLSEALGDASPRIVVPDTIDPWSFGSVLDSLDLSRTVFNVISKSGETVETTAQFLIVRDLLLRQLGAVDYAQRLIITTDADSGALRQVVHDEGFRDLALPAGIGGRFSVLTAAGLFPAAVAGVRVDDILAGAAWMDSRCQEADLWHNPGYLLGTFLYLAETHHEQNIVVLMPYSTRLGAFGAWFAQLWAGSLGKGETLEGMAVHVGQTPVAAVGAADEHTLLQLLAEGPVDKVVVLVRVEDHGREVPTPASYADLDGVSYLGGVGLGQLLNAQQRATELTLVKRQRPVISLTAPQVSPFTLGQLIYLFETAAVFAAALHRIDPFTQPSFAESRRLLYGQVGRKGSEDTRAEVEAWVAAKRKELVL